MKIQNKKNKKLIKNILIVVVILLALFLLSIDYYDYFTHIKYSQKQSKGHLYNINLKNWIALVSPFIAVWGTYYYIKDQIKVQKEQYENDLKVQKEYYEKTQEEQRENNDKIILSQLYKEETISKISIWILSEDDNSINKYKYYISKLEGSDIKNIEDKSIKDKHRIISGDLNCIYKLYEDIELMNIFLTSKKNQKILKQIIINKKDKDQKEKIEKKDYKIKSLINPKRYYHQLQSISKQEEYEKEIKQIRRRMINFLKDITNLK